MAIPILVLCPWTVFYQFHMLQDTVEHARK
jgi:hypothetical protein